MLQVIRFFYYILFLLTPLIIYSQTSELFEFNKMVFIYLIGAIITFVWILYRTQQQSFSIIKYVAIVPFLLFLITQVISTIYSIDIHTSLFGYYGRFNGGLLSIITYLTLFYIAIDIGTVAFFFTILRVSIVASTITILWGLPGKFGHDLSCMVFTANFYNTPFFQALAEAANNNCWTEQFKPAERMFSTLGQPNWLGAYLSINFFIGLFFLVILNGWRKILIAGYILLNFAAILFTRSDAALLATAVGMVIFTILTLLHTESNRRIVVRSLILLGCGFLVLLFSFKTGISRVDKYLSFEFSNKQVTQPQKVVSPSLESARYLANTITDSFDIRKIVWEGAIELGKRYPVVGTGVETFAYAYYFTRPMAHNATSEWDFIYNKAHNEFLNYFATTGYLGLVAYLLMIITVIFLTWKYISGSMKMDAKYGDKKTIQIFFIMLLSLFSAILINNFFGFSTTVVNLYFYILPASLFVVINNGQLMSLKIHSLWIRIPATIIFFVLLSNIIFYFFADLQYAVADTKYREGDYYDAALLLNDAIKFHYEPVYEDKLSTVLANMAYLSYYQKETEAGNKFIDLSIKYNSNTIKISPKNVSYWKTMAKNQFLFYQSTLDQAYLEKGLQALDMASQLAPTDPRIVYNKALYYSLLEDIEKDTVKKKSYKDKSLRNVNEVLRMKENYTDAYLLKAQLLQKYGNNKEARDVLEFVLRSVSPDDEEVKLMLKEID